ncbi:MULTISPECIES: TetR/AcrR family transcriptional regulator [unclassified Breznakia]|uniref:TetR/AcrR family transcriptional regulator n=1 Tax=unclassified Breznakia TaxID=2623764 RepID=UPI00240719C0|nr:MULTISPECIES: TetR/AcrR family transcriptional regulator [unclassified Breznakia]MDF9837553.1 AcrR family transcriptional regulator [Breznakia sp. PFB2-8]MDF9860555.1 AcrR family transcriptional regulator [Breznakia sp. PH5-24]
MENREKILTTALSLFAKDGLQSTTTAKIANAANVSNGTLFYYFKTKDELIVSLYLWKIDSFRKTISDGIADSSLNKDSVKKVWYACLNWFLKNKEAFIFFNMYSTLPDLRYLREQQPAATFVFIKKVFEELIKKGYFIDVPDQLIVSSFYGSIISIFDYCVASNDDESKYKEVSFAMWWKSIAKDKV